MLQGSSYHSIDKRVMIANDHPIVRRGLRALIDARPGWAVCSEVSTGLEALGKSADVRPDFIVMDQCMPELDGYDATKQIVTSQPAIGVLILTTRRSQEVAAEAMRSGARGHLSMDDCDEKLMEALEALSRGKTYFAGRVSRYDEARRDAPRGSRTEELTVRERQIVKLVAEGMSNKVIAAHLSISIKTVETHRAAAMQKAGVSTVAGLTMYAARNHLVEV